MDSPYLNNGDLFADDEFHAPGAFEEDPVPLDLEFAEITLETYKGKTLVNILDADGDTVMTLSIEEAHEIIDQDKNDDADCWKTPCLVCSLITALEGVR